VYGDPPQGNANYAWLQHMLHHLKPTGRAGIVLANGSMSSSQNSEGEIRAAMVDADVVEVIVALPGQLFFNTQIPACLWFLVKQKTHRKGEMLLNTEKYITEAGLNGSSTKLLPTGTTIISARGTVVRLALTGCPMSMNQSCYDLYGHAGDNYFTYFGPKRMVDQLNQRAHGSVFGTITQ
jgi:hypothetical protein